MKIAMIVIRSLMGLFLLFGASIFLFKLVPMPEPVGDAKVYSDGLAIVHLMVVVKVIEFLCGIAFLTGRYVTLAVVVLFPIIVNILIFHGIVAPSTIWGGVIILLGDLFLAYYYRRNYVTLFAAK